MEPVFKGVNEFTPMTIRYPKLPDRILKRDSEIAMKLIKAKDNYELLAVFLKEAKNLSDERYWEMLRTVWISAGSSQLLDKFLPLLNSKRKERYYFSTPEEAKRLREMPENFIVYRAINEGQENISWTIKRAVAEKFQSLYKKDKIEERTVSKKEVFAFIERRGEEEVLILPK